jgi:hypothetical protein
MALHMKLLVTCSKDANNRSSDVESEGAAIVGQGNHTWLICNWAHSKLA